jgi:hypothetical protein
VDATNLGDDVSEYLILTKDAQARGLRLITWTTGDGRVEYNGDGRVVTARADAAGVLCVFDERNTVIAMCAPPWTAVIGDPRRYALDPEPGTR